MGCKQFHLGFTAVDDIHHIIDSDWCLCDVGRQDNLLDKHIDLKHEVVSTIKIIEQNYTIILKVAI